MPASIPKAESEKQGFKVTDPATLAELDALTDPLDRADAIMGLEMLERFEKEGGVPWEHVKKELDLE